MAENFSPTATTVTKALLSSFNGDDERALDSNYIGSFEITQSMDSVAWHGKLNVLDTSGILEGMPIRGEETLKLWIVAHDLETTVKLDAVVHKVDGIKPLASGNGVMYTLHFISEDSFNASYKKVTTAFLKEPSEMAVDIFEQNFAKIIKPATSKDDNNKPLPYEAKMYQKIPANKQQGDSRTFVVMPSKNKTQLIIPDLSPAEAMFFVASRCYNPGAPSQTFRFFETLDGYYFATDEYFIKQANNNKAQITQLSYAPIVDADGTNAIAQVERIEQLHIISKSIDSSGDMSNGSYRNEVLELDLVKRKVSLSKFNYDDASYIDMNGVIKTLADNPHTKEYREKHFTESPRRFMAYKNFDSPGDLASSEVRPDQHIAEIVHNRVAYYHHLNNTQLAVVMTNRLDLKPGMLVKLDIKALDGVQQNIEQNNSLSGRYIIKETVHQFANDKMTCSMRLAKFDWSGLTDTTAETVDIGGTNLAGNLI
jgi:hypothetical protein